ncbi:MAG: hypothetical protein PHY34_06480 [Patescibacteria group bacterium]|nr:hypothetical protein [Patescibacteria group bacterium]MDD5716068.1 hypothetical protein [Patescibacteria group bacterium]
MHNLMHLTDFLEWIRTLPPGTHIGDAIRDASPPKPSFRVNSLSPLFFAVLTTNNGESHAGFVSNIELDCAENTFSVTFYESEKLHKTVRLSELQSFEPVHELPRGKTSRQEKLTPNDRRTRPCPETARVEGSSGIHL